eukprot:357752_1
MDRMMQQTLQTQPRCKNLKCIIFIVGVFFIYMEIMIVDQYIKEIIQQRHQLFDVTMKTSPTASPTSVFEWYKSLFVEVNFNSTSINEFDINSISFTVNDDDFLETNISSVEWLIFHNITKMAIFSDSHGPKWLSAIINGMILESKFKNNSLNISEIKNESGSKLVDKQFYGINNMLTHTRECSGCQSKIIYLTDNNYKKYQVLYLSQESILNTEIQKFYSHWTNGHNASLIKQNSYSTQEFYLKNYFKLTGYPNIIIRFATYQHDIGRFTEIEFKRNFRYYLQLLLDYVNTNNTKIIWISTMSFATVWHNESTMHLNEKIWRFNNIAVSEIVKYAKNSIHIFPLDLFQISLQLRQLYGNRWNENHGLDTAHLHAMFYDQLMQLVWKWIQMNYQL